MLLSGSRAGHTFPVSGKHNNTLFPREAQSFFGDKQAMPPGAHQGRASFRKRFSATSWALTLRSNRVLQRLNSSMS